MEENFVKSKEIIVQGKSKYKNKDAAEFKLFNDGGEDIDIVPVDRPNEPEEITKKREKYIEEIINTNSNPEFQNKKVEPEILISDNLKQMISKIRDLNIEILNEYLKEGNLTNLFEKELNMKLDELNEEELNFVYKIFKIDSNDVKGKEYNEYGLPKDIDPEVLEYVSMEPFNPDTDQYIPPVFENLDCDRIHIDLQRNELDEEYREVYDNLLHDENVKEYKDVENKNKINEIVEEDNDFFPDDFVLIANGGKLPLEIDEDAKKLIYGDLKEAYKIANVNPYKKDNKEEEKNVQNVKNTEPNKFVKDLNKDNYIPSYKYITPEEVKLLNSQYKEVEEEYKEPANVENSSKQKVKISKENKAKLLEALEEMEEIYVNTKLPNRPDEEEIEEEEYEDEEEEFEEYEEENLDGFDNKELKDLKVQDGVDLISKENIDKLLNYYNPENKNVQKTKNKKDKKNDKNDQLNLNNDELNEENKLKKKNKEKKFLTWDEINEIAQNEEVLEKTLLMIQDYAEDEEKKQAQADSTAPSKKRLVKYKKDAGGVPEVQNVEPDYYTIHHPKLYDNIMNTMNSDVTDLNAPKKVGVKSEKIRMDKTNRTLLATTKINDTNITTTRLDKPSKPVVILSRKDNSEITRSTQPTKENELNNDQDDKKERKKEIKKENKERREQKKALKEAFKKEKIRVQKVISNTNKVIRSGLSIKEV